MDMIVNVDSECSYEIDDDICFSDNVISKLSTLVDHGGGSNIIKGDSKHVIVGKLLEKTNCNDQLCVLNNPLVVSVLGNDLIEREKEERFKPYGPSNTIEWINDIHIKEVFGKYAKKFKSFYYFPYQMIDFYKFSNKFTKADWIKLIKFGYDKFAVIINTDKWDGGGNGIHWFCIFIDVKSMSAKYGEIIVEYFNSSGNEPLVEILRWFSKLKVDLETKYRDQGKIVDVKFIEPLHRTQVQFDTHSCGVYCLFYIYYRLLGYKVEEFNRNTIYDSKMMKFRQFLFRNRK